MPHSAAPLFLASLSILMASHVLAQEAVEPTDAPAETAQDQVPTEGVVAELALWALQPVLDEAGLPVLDESGEPTEEFQPVLEGTALLPGDEIRYVLTLSNEGDDAEALQLALDLPAEALLLPETVTASADSTFEFGSSADPALREPLFVEIDGTSVPNPDWAAAPESFDLLVTSIERLAADAAATVTYDLVVR